MPLIDLIVARGVLGIRGFKSPVPASWGWRCARARACADQCSQRCWVLFRVVQCEQLVLLGVSSGIFNIDPAGVFPARTAALGNSDLALTIPSHPSFAQKIACVVVVVVCLSNVASENSSADSSWFGIGRYS